MLRSSVVVAGLICHICLFTTSVALAQANPQPAVLTALSDAFSHGVAMKETAQSCSKVAPDQTQVFADAYALWAQRNLNETSFLTDAIKSYFENRGAELSSFEVNSIRKAKADLAATNLNQASCTQWLVRATSSRELDFYPKLPVQMKALEARFVKAS
jgi:hypothetical protein